MGLQTKFYDQEQEKQIVKDYLSGIGTTTLRNKYGFRTNKSITDKVKKFGYEIRSNREEKMLNKSYDEFQFNVIDTEFKAYFVGLLASDGYVVKNQIGLSMIDEDVIKFVATSLCKKYSTISRDLPRHTIFRIILNSQRMVKELSELGIENKKSKTIKSINLNLVQEEVIPYIVRGIIDGDGWIRSDGKEFFICSASLNFIQWLQYVLVKKLYMKNINITMGQHEMYYIRSAFQHNICILKTIVYDKEYGMQRKFKLLHDELSETTIGLPE